MLSSVMLKHSHSNFRKTRDSVVRASMNREPSTRRNNRDICIKVAIIGRQNTRRYLPPGSSESTSVLDLIVSKLPFVGRPNHPDRNIVLTIDRRYVHPVKRKPFYAWKYTIDLILLASMEAPAFGWACGTEWGKRNNWMSVSHAYCRHWLTYFWRG